MGLRKSFAVNPDNLPKNDRVNVRNETLASGLRVRVYSPKNEKEEYPALLWIYGGDLSAATTLMTRDKKDPALCFQMLLYPMLDYRNVTPSSHQLNDHHSWSRDSNLAAWGMYLADVSGDVPAYASPSMAGDLSGLPPAYVLAYGLDPFRDEDIDYAQRLMKAGVPVELHVVPGVTHSFEFGCAGTEIADRTVREYVNALYEAMK